MRAKTLVQGLVRGGLGFGRVLHFLVGAKKNRIPRKHKNITPELWIRSLVFTRLVCVASRYFHYKPTLTRCKPKYHSFHVNLLLRS